MKDMHASDYDLDALRIGALGADRGAEVESHLAACERCAARRSALAEAAVAFRREIDVEALVSRTLAAGKDKRNVAGPEGGLAALRSALGGRRGWWVGAATALAASSALLFVAIDRRPEGVDLGLRTKSAGEAAEVFVLERGVPVPWRGAPLPTGARLAVRVGPGRRHVRALWASRDRGIEALLPAEGAPALVPSRSGWLDAQIAVDEGGEDERLHVVACEEPVEHREALEVVRGSSARPDCAVVDREIERATGASGQ